MGTAIQSDLLVVGGGLAGIVTALEAVRAGKRVVIVNRDKEERFGGMAYWAFGGMALIGTPLQKRMKINDSPELALADWMRFGELDPNDTYPMQWATYYVDKVCSEAHDWLKNEGLKFMPAVNWVERGRNGDGNSVPRYHIIWGTSREMVLRLTTALKDAASNGQLQLFHQHCITSLDHAAGKVSGAVATNEVTGDEVRFAAANVVLAMGGINGSLDEARANWPADRPQPSSLLNGMNPLADGKLHHWTADHLGGRITHAGEMWNYAAGIPHPQPHFDGHGLSLIPCKSALWLDHRGRRIGPEPLVTGFDTHWLCQRIAAQQKPWSWQLLNWRIAAKEFAISGAEHNKYVREKKFLHFAAELLRGNHRLVRQMQQQSDHFLVADTLPQLVGKMNQLTGTNDVEISTLQATVNGFDANFQHGTALQNDAQIRLINHCRQWKADKLRTCKPAPLQQKGAGPLIAIKTQLITRKSLGGLRTDLQSRVLDANDQPIDGLYCVGEAAGFGGGGSNGKRSLEGTFLPGCILTARAAARSIVTGK